MHKYQNCGEKDFRAKVFYKEKLCYIEATCEIQLAKILYLICLQNV